MSATRMAVEASRPGPSAAGLALPGSVHERAGRAFGSALRLLVEGSTGVTAATVDRAWLAVLGELEAVDRAISRFRPDSELTALNLAAGTGGRWLVGRRLRAALALADRAHRVTGGRFDPEVHALLEAWDERGAFAREAVAPPATAASDPRGHPVAVPPRPVDLGGIGKGLALRWATRAARDALPTDAGILLDCGGDLAAVGSPGRPWSVGIEDPAAGPGRGPVAVVSIAAGALATSSVRVRRWNAPRGTTVHHLVDPRSDAPARTGLLSVTVHDADPAWAEVRTKALFLTGRAGIADEARAAGLAAWWIGADGSLGMTPAARAMTAWAAEARVGG